MLCNKIKSVLNYLWIQSLFTSYTLSLNVYNSEKYVLGSQIICSKRRNLKRGPSKEKNEKKRNRTRWAYGKSEVFPFISRAFSKTFYALCVSCFGWTLTKVMLLFFGFSLSLSSNQTFFSPFFHLFLFRFFSFVSSLHRTTLKVFIALKNPNIKLLKYTKQIHFFFLFFSSFDCLCANFILRNEWIQVKKRNWISSIYRINGN